jgi:hypothetical protein
MSERKPQNRARTSAQESVLRLLERQRMKPPRLPLVEPILPTLHKPPPADANDPNIIDFWDKSLIDTAAENKYDIFSPEAESGLGI